MKKEIIFVLLWCVFPIISNAQDSKMENMLTPVNYKTLTTLIKNYDGKNNFIMSYGHYTNAFNPDNDINFSSFYIQNPDNGQIQHIVDLPYGYKVNDIQFVDLRLIENEYPVSYCCFCGTRTLGYEYVYPVIRDSSIVYITPITIGFVGYFKTLDAINPSSQDSAIVRNIECSRELHKMICYAEQGGVNSSYQSTYIDNAVLDVIGIADDSHQIHNGLSALWRVKFYPQCPYTTTYPSGTIWDNNIRYNEDNAESLRDIIGVGSYVVTVSQPANDDKNIWLRYSNKEMYLYNGGMNLNSNVEEIGLSSLSIDNNSIANANLTFYTNPLKLSSMTQDNLSLAFKIKNNADSIDGIFIFKKDFNDYSNILNGVYVKGPFELDELTYLPYNNVSTFLYHIVGEDTKYTGSVFWNYLKFNNYITDNFSCSNNISSFCAYYTGFECLSWSGVAGSNYSKPALMCQRYGYPLNSIEHCQSLARKYSSKSQISVTNYNHPFLIKERYVDNQYNYIVSKIPFMPFFLETQIICTK